MPKSQMHAGAPAWQPDQLGLPWSLALSSLTVAAAIAATLFAIGHLDQPPQPPPMQVRLQDMAPEPAARANPMAAPSEPAAPAPPLPESAPTLLPQPAPPILLAPGPAMPGRIVLAPAEPVHTPEPPARRAVLHRQSQAYAPSSNAPSASLPSPPAPPAPITQAAPADTTSGLGPYRAALHTQIARNVEVTPDMEAGGTGGTTVVEATIAPNGHVLAAHVARSSGSPAIDRVALAAVQRGGYRPFGDHMPAAPIIISVPIAVGPG